MSTQPGKGIIITMRVKLFVRRGHRQKALKSQKQKGRRLITFKGEEGKRPRRILAGVCAFILLIFILRAMRMEPSLMASAEVATVHDNGVLRVGVRTDMPGMALDGEGLEVELATILAERILSYDEDWTGFQDAVELVPVTAMSVGSKLNDGSIDVAIAMMPRGGSSSYAYSTAYYVDTCRFVTRLGEENRPIKDMTIGWLQSATVSGMYVPTSCFNSILNAYLEAHPEDGLITKFKFNDDDITYTYASYDELFAALLAGKVDAIVLSDLYLDKYAEQYAVGRSDTVLGTISYSVATSTSTPALASIADMVLSDLRESGALMALYAKYGLAVGETQPTQTP